MSCVTCGHEKYEHSHPLGYCLQGFLVLCRCQAFKESKKEIESEKQMSKDVGYFKPEDFVDQSPGCLSFYNQDGLQLSATKAALLANAKLQKDAKVIYGYLSTNKFIQCGEGYQANTHQALLIAIKPIEKAQAECEHRVATKTLGGQYCCTNCNELITGPQLPQPSKPPCEHPNEKITMTVLDVPAGDEFIKYKAKCDCGQNMQIKFEPVEK